jgi:hypothetical protein
MTHHPSEPMPESIEALEKRLGKVDMRQILIWRQMTPAQRLDIAFQAYQFALDIVRMTEEKHASGLTPEQFAWRVTRRMQGDQNLGREYDDVRPAD